MDISITERSGYRIATLEGEFSLYNVRDMKEMIFNNITTESTGMIIDMERVSYMDSSAIGVLYAAQRKLNALKKDLYLARVSGDLLDVMKLAGISFKMIDPDKDL
jgi:anti-sigma B factor antagonist